MVVTAVKGMLFDSGGVMDVEENTTCVGDATVVEKVWGELGVKAVQGYANGVVDATVEKVLSPGVVGSPVVKALRTGVEKEVVLVVKGENVA